MTHGWVLKTIITSKNNICDRKKYGIVRKTARRYMKAESRHKYTYKRPKHKMIEDYTDYINELLKQASMN